MPNLRSIAVWCVLAVAAVSVASACGPGFPWQLLDNRAETLKQMPDPSFAFEVAHLAPAPADAPKPSGWKLTSNQQDAEYAGFRNGQTMGDFERNLVESQMLSPAQMQEIAAVRAAETDEDAAEAGKDLPRDVFYYALGASDFLGDNLDDAMDELRQSVEAAKDRPTAHAVWAEFMIGRILDARGDQPGADNAFAQLRHMVQAGAPDPLDVAIASYGEEARVLVQAADRIKLAGSKDWQAARADLLMKAVRLYALQNAVSPGAGEDSMLVMADEILFDPYDLDNTISDDLTRTLVVDYAISRGEGYEDSGGHDNTFIFDNAYRAIGAFDKAALRQVPKEFDPVGNLLSTLESHGITAADGADRLAVLAYRAGRYDLAQGYARRSKTPLALWIQAKLAVRSGDNKAAAGFYAQGVAALAETSQPPLQPEIQTRIRGEQSVLTLSRQDYTGALAQLYPEAGTYWGDVAYLAERVLTLDELKAFVDHTVPAIPDPSKPETGFEEFPRDAVIFSNVPALTRELLARRMVREGNAEAAIPYFSGKNQELARQYDAALKAVAHASDRVTHAEALYRQAAIERHNGLELMGYEADPDYEIYDGGFGEGLGQTSVFGYQPKDGQPPSFDAAFTSAGEAKRFGVSAAIPNERYHYRYVAEQHTLAAADLLPPRSQAFGAVLCKAASYVGYRDDVLVASIYQRYVREGAYMPWAAKFAADCPQPDFEEARHFEVRHATHRLAGSARRHQGLAGAAAAGLVASGTGLIVRHNRRRRRRPTA